MSTRGDAMAGGDATLTTSPDAGTTPGIWVSTNRYDNFRSGATYNETVLTPATVSGGKFGLLFTMPVDGTVQAQVLYAPNITVPGKGTHNLAIASTENDSVYAYDADTAGTAVWKTSLGTPFVTGNNTGGNLTFSCQDIYPLVGIHSTPAIDPATQTLYVLAKVSQGGAAHQFLHALDLTTGSDKSGSPVEIKGSVAGTASDAVGGTLSFDPKKEMSRAGILLANGVIYIAWAGHCDDVPWHGWVIAYDAATLAQKGVYSTTPNGNAGGIWQSGMGLSSDSSGGVYFVSGNGDFDTGGKNGNNVNKSMSVGKLTLGAGGLTLADSYTTHNASTEGTINVDEDLTTAAVIGPDNGYLYMSGKDSVIRVLQRTNLGGYNPSGDKIPQSVNMGADHLHGGPVVWNGSKPSLFAWPESGTGGLGVLMSYPLLSTGLLNTSHTSGNVGYAVQHPGGMITVSSNGTTAKTGVVWSATLTQAANNSGTSTAAWHGIVAGELYAFDAENVGTNLWNSQTNSADNLGMFAKFCPPVVANGKVYIGTAINATTGVANSIHVYGLKP